ncbi:hypothetical protein [Bacillus paranthracis]|uniref:hypothetical protein n=1 Tax=Bacillus paranthracis TaxID=2026186 RepID=UPI002D7A1184|nr:hypothetical protein [Bacillus paranthracis]
MKLTVKQQFLVGKVEETKKSFKYTLLTFGEFDKVVLFGKFGMFEHMEKVEATIEINIKTERLKIQGMSEDQYKDIARVFLVNLEKLEG